MAGLLLFPAAAPGHTGCRTRRCEERVHRKKCNQTHPRHCVERAILTYRLGAWQAAWMRRVPACESGWDPWERNAGPESASGLYQFLPSTWRTTRYASHDIFSAKWNSLAAASFIRAGQQSQWVCKLASPQRRPDAVSGSYPRLEPVRQKWWAGSRR